MYGKHYESLYTGSMIGAGAIVYAVWGYVIANRRQDLVELNSVLLAFVFGESEADVEAAIVKLCSPDSKSRSKDEEGRRLIREGQFTYRVVNARTYDEIANEYDRRERDKIRKREERKSEGKAGSSTGSKGEADDMEKAIKSYHADARTVLHVLNELSGKHFRETDTNLATISMRLNEDGVNLDGIKLMICRQCKRWKGTEQSEYLRPETLFGKVKFDGYYASKEEPIYEQNDGRVGKRGFDRNAGTFNAGKTERYDTAKIQAARELREQQSREGKVAGGDSAVCGQP